MASRPDLIEAVRRAVEQRRGAHHRHADNGDLWIDCRCPLHDDAHRSASFNASSGTFVCRVCAPGQSIDLDRVAAALSVAPPSLHANGHQRQVTLREPEIEVGRWPYDYYWPNGELSHRHWRIQLQAIDPVTGKPKKRYLHQLPSGEWQRPTTYWPLYADYGLAQGVHLVIVEGEPPADAINCSLVQVANVPVAAITAGSTSDLLQAIEILASRLDDLKPQSLTLWPDADEPGLKAMRELRRKLAERHHAATLIDPAEVQLSNKQDAVEFVLRGGDLALLIAGLHRPNSAIRPQDVADQLLITEQGVIWPQSDRICKLDQSIAGSLWQVITGKLPTDRQAKEVLGIMRDRQFRDPVVVHWRLYADAHRVVWRPDPLQECYQITEHGIELVPDSPTGTLLVPGTSRLPAQADEHGTSGHYQQLCDFFGLSELERTLILSWMVCCLLGRETPILLMRGQAGTGKSTLANFILGLIEPTCREIDLEGQRNFSDHRQLLQTLRQVPAALIDNLTAMSAGMEDVLSRLVTGYSSSVMWKYSNDVEQIQMHRGIIITTTNWDVYKGDLASRTIVCQPRIRGGWIDRSDINERFLPMLPMIRGFVFRQVHRVLAARPGQDSSFRVASMGRVLDALGYDSRALAEQEAREKARLLNQNDPWLQALVDIWDAQNQGGEFLFSLGQIIEKMRELGVPFEALPAPSGPKFSKWVEEKHMLFRDHGFYLERYRDASMRGYWFRRVKE